RTGRPDLRRGRRGAARRRPRSVRTPGRRCPQTGLACDDRRRRDDLALNDDHHGGAGHLGLTGVGSCVGEDPHVAWPAVRNSLLAALDFIDPEKLIVRGGYLFVFAIVFAESGLLIGFFLPG